jgi:hypothetical protein
MKLILYNYYHNGDQYFSQPIIKAIRKYNPSIEIIVNLTSYSFLYSDINNIITSPICESSYSNYSYHIIDENTVMINTWIAAILPTNYSYIECCSPRIYKLFKELYAEKFHINMPDILDIELLPKTPKTDISAFINWKNTHNSAIVFYNDVIPKSGQQVSSTEHNVIIDKLCGLFPDIYFITSEKLCDSKNNISTIHDFKYTQTNDCENLCKNTNMYPHCNLIISFDVGACFNYIEEEVLRSKATVLHIGCTSRFFDQLSYNVINTELHNLFVDKSIFCEALDTSQVIKIITNKIGEKLVITSNPENVISE